MSRSVFPIENGGFFNQCHVSELGGGGRWLHPTTVVTNEKIFQTQPPETSSPIQDISKNVIFRSPGVMKPTMIPLMKNLTFWQDMWDLGRVGNVSFSMIGSHNNSEKAWVDSPSPEKGRFEAELAG